MEKERPQTAEIPHELEKVRLLTETENLNRLRLPDGTHDPGVLADELMQLTTAIKETGIPHAVSTTYQTYRDGKYWWLDRSDDEVAANGYTYHFSAPAYARVGVEQEEARHVRDNLQPGMVSCMISPKMSAKDAPPEIAKQEHLANEDMIRIQMPDVDEQTGKIRGKYLQSVSVKDVPLEAWITMLADPSNIFGRVVTVDDPESALSVMKAFTELDVSIDQLPEGAITVVDAVKPYCDSDTQARIEEQLAWLRMDQIELHQKATHIAERWLAFEVELADSRHYGYATPVIEEFIADLSDQWSVEFNELLKEHIERDGSIRMSDDLAALLERSRQNTLIVAAAVVSDNQDVISKVEPHIAKAIYEAEMSLQILQQNNMLTMHEMQRQETANSQRIAHANIKVGGGCPGETQGAFGGDPSKAPDSKVESKEACVIKTNCPNCSNLNLDGTARKEKVQVVAVIDASKTIHCRRCSAWANDKSSFQGFIKMRAKTTLHAEDEKPKELPSEADLAAQVDAAYTEQGIESFEQEAQKAQQQQAQTPALV